MAIVGLSNMPSGFLVTHPAVKLYTRTFWASWACTRIRSDARPSSRQLDEKSAIAVRTTVVARKSQSERRMPLSWEEEEQNEESGGPESAES